MAEFAPLDSATTYGYTCSIDGVAIDVVGDISGIKLEVDKITHNQQTKDGKFVTRNLIGRQKAGTFTVTRGLTQNMAVADWLKMVFQGDIQGARKTAEVGITNYAGEIVRRITFENCWVMAVEVGQLEPGGTKPLTEKFTIAYDSASFA